MTMQRVTYESLWSFRTDRFCVALFAEPEEMDPADSFEFAEDIETARSGEPHDWFYAKVVVYLDGEEVGTDYLGGCSYSSFEDFYESHRDPNPNNRNTLALKERNTVICHYFPDMVRQAIAEARTVLRHRAETLPRLRA